jgi:hypothetical protein
VRTIVVQSGVTALHCAAGLPLRKENDEEYQEYIFEGYCDDYGDYSDPTRTDEVGTVIQSENAVISTVASSLVNESAFTGIGIHSLSLRAYIQLHSHMLCISHCVLL